MIPSNVKKAIQTRKQTNKNLDQETGRVIEVLTSKSHPHNNQHKIAQIGQIGTNPPQKTRGKLNPNKNQLKFPAQNDEDRRQSGGHTDSLHKDT